MVLIFFLITPLQSAILGTGEILVQRPATVLTTAKLMDPLAQAARLDQAVLNTGYAITWLNRPYPAFTTAEYALMPFQPEGYSSYVEQPANWTGLTTKYWTELHCWPVEGLPAWENGPLTFFDGKKCNTSKIVVQTAVHGTKPYKMQYIGYQNAAWADNTLAAPSCGRDAWNEFLATWAYYDEPNEKIDITASFCEPSYFQQKVTASVRATDLRPITESIKPHEEPRELSASDFNSSAFHFLIGSGVPPVTTPRDYPFTHLVEHAPRLNGTGLAYPLSPMTGFALGGQNYSVPDYRNRSIMDAANRAAHQHLFSVAMSYALTNETKPNPTSGEVFYVKYGIIVSRPFATTVEVALVVVACLMLTLYWKCSRCESMLSEDPGSLGSLMNLVKNSHELLDQFNGQDTLTEDQLTSALGNHKFVMLCGCQNVSGATAIKILEYPTQKTEDDEQVSPHKGKLNIPGHYTPIKPIVLHQGIGFLFLLCLCAAIAVLVTLKEREKILGGKKLFKIFLPENSLTSIGLALPSSSFEVNLILTSFIPTAFSTLVEPFWVLLNRLLCILQPFQDLWAKPKAADRSLRVRYTAVPPPLAIWRAAKSGHFLLVGLCAVAMLANVLAVGLGGLFNEAPKTVIYDIDAAPLRNAVFNSPGLDEFYRSISYALASNYEDPYYVAMANISAGNSLTPWTDAEFFYLPLNVSKSDAADGIYNAITTGIGIEPSCLPVHSMISVDEPPGIPTTGRDGSEREGCPLIYYPESLLLNTSRYHLPQGAAAVEIIDTPSSGYNASDCDVSLVVGWSRSSIANETGTMNTTMVVCRPTIKTATFNVAFDARGYIQNSTAISEFSPTLPYPDFASHEMTIISHINHKLRDRQIPWHNESISHEWFHYLLKIQTGDESILDANAPLPDPDAMIPSVTSVYKMLFVLFVSLNQYVFELNEGKTAIPATRITSETRIFVSTTAFIISLTVLSINVIMAIVFYCWGIKSFLPRMPTTIGSLLAYIAPSKAVREYSSGRLETSRTFGFGRYVGDDGHAHIGIDYSEKIVPLTISSLKRGDTVPNDSKLGKLWHRSSTKKQGETWL